MFPGDGLFISLKNYIDWWELWTDEDFETVAVEVKCTYRIYLGSDRDLQSSKRRHAIYRKTSSPHWLYGKLQSIASLG